MCYPSWIWSISIGYCCSCMNGINSGPEGCWMSAPPSVTPPSNCCCICSKLTNSRWANCPWPEVEPLRLCAFCFRGLMLLLLWNCCTAPVVLAVVETPPPAPTMFAKFLRLCERCCWVNLSDRFLFWIFYSPLCKFAIIWLCWDEPTICWPWILCCGPAVLWAEGAFLEGFFFEKVLAETPETGPELLMLVWKAWFWLANRLWLFIPPPFMWLMLLLWLCRAFAWALRFDYFYDLCWSPALLRSIFWFSNTCRWRFSIEWLFYCFSDFLGCYCFGFGFRPFKDSL